MRSSWRLADGILVCGALCVFLSATSVRADDFVMTVSVNSKPVNSKKREVKTKFTYEKPSGKKLQKRPVFKAAKGELLNVKWSGKNAVAGDSVKDLLIHFFVVKQKQTGQEKVPKLGNETLHEGALVMDFKPSDSVSGEFTIRIRKAGSYLVRVETIGMADKHGHDHYAALDIVVE